MNNPIVALKNFTRPSGLKSPAAKPDNVSDHAAYLAKRNKDGESGPIYLKSNLFGQKYLSSKPPKWGKKDALKAYDTLLMQTAWAHRDKDAAETRVGLTARELQTVLERSIPANPAEAAARTKQVELLIAKLDRKKRGISDLADGEAKPSAAQVQTPSQTPSTVVANPKIASTAENTQEDLPEFPTSAELSAFQRDLQRGHIIRPVYADVARFVEHRNHTQGTISDRKLPSAERNEADDLLAYITQNITAKATYKDGQWQEGRQTNTFGGRTFHSRLEAARFLFTETNFFKKLNPLDAAVYLGIYQDLIKEAREAQQEQQRLG